MSSPCSAGGTGETASGLACVTNDAAGSLNLARLFYLDEQGRFNGDTASGIVSNIVAYGYLFAQSKCSSSVVQQQAITVNCDHPEFEVQAAQADSSCRQCLNYVYSIVQDRNKLEQEAAQKSNGAYRAQVPDDSHKHLLEGATQDYRFGACRMVCAQCVAENLSQDLQVRIGNDCSTATTDFRTAFLLGMTQQAQRELQNKTDALGTVGQDIKTNAKLDALSISIANTISAISQTKVLTSLQQQALARQTIQIDNKSTSVYVNNVAQTINVNLMASLASTVYNDAELKTAINYNQLKQTIQNEDNLANNVKMLTDAFNTIKDLLSQILGQLTLALVVVLMIGLFGLAGYFFFKKEINQMKNGLSYVYNAGRSQGNKAAAKANQSYNQVKDRSKIATNKIDEAIRQFS